MVGEARQVRKVGCAVIAENQTIFFILKVIAVVDRCDLIVFNN